MKESQDYKERFRHFDERLVKNLLKELTHSGKDSLDVSAVKRIKQVCRSDDKITKLAYRLLLKHLQRKHSEVRLSSIQLIHVLFMRSHQFRLLLLDDINDVAELCLGANNGKDSLPPPKKAASLLKQTFKSCVQEWHGKFSCGYFRLKQLHSNLQQIYRVNFDDSRTTTTVPGITAQLNGNSVSIDDDALALQQLQSEVAEHRSNMLALLSQTDEYFSLLLPDLQLFDQIQHHHHHSPASHIPGADSTEHAAPCHSAEIPDDVESDDEQDDNYEEDEMCMHRAHGILSARQSVQVTLRSSRMITVRVSEHNCHLVASLRDLVGQVSRDLLPRAARWVTMATTANADSSIMTHLLQMRRALQSVLTRFDCVIFQNNNNNDDEQQGDSGDEDEDFIEAPCEPRLERLFDLPSRDPVTSSQSEGVSGPSWGVRCGARLPSGALCPRVDSVRCPLHGVRVSRDHSGRPLDPLLRQQEQEREMSREDWQDPRLLAQLRVSTGQDLSLRSGRRGGATRSNNQLTPIKSSTCHQRLNSKMKKLRRC